MTKGNFSLTRLHVCKRQKERKRGARTCDESASYHFLPQTIFTNETVSISNKAHFPQPGNCWPGLTVPDFWIYLRVNIVFFPPSFNPTQTLNAAQDFSDLTTTFSISISVTQSVSQLLTERPTD